MSSRGQKAKAGSSSSKKRKQRKLEYRLRRKNSVLMANFREEFTTPGGLQRSWSCVELGKTQCRETTSTKRVSFSLRTPTNSVENLESLPNPKKEPRSILRSNTSFLGGKDSLTHMDFDTFSAWRRGSKMSDDVVRFQQCSVPTLEEMKRKQKRKENDEENHTAISEDDWWIVKVFKLGITSCFNRRSVNPDPPETINVDSLINMIIAY
ncbi:unnamed protein product [Caenorhabditis bovis]|uniref:Uncharacterized protein n=1 Tax=Caenorhabditis bovis TaxID=2654633 RepID=A0A8S1EDN1_9PELO|nr:unnamed protein product [Caenorhabditis bovis]